MRNVRENGRLAALGVSLATAADTLVMYTYSNSDPEYERNLQFFVKYGMSEGDGCDYVVIVQEACGPLVWPTLHHFETICRPLSVLCMVQGDKLFGSSPLPQLPQNARYVFHENRCFDWGTFGWAIAERKLDTSRYAYIIFMNSSVRGPFLPAFWPVRARWRHAGVPRSCSIKGSFMLPQTTRVLEPFMCSRQAGVHWSDVLTTRINNDVKLVGATISCEPAWMNGNMSNEKRQVPHVQSYVMATDQAGSY